MGVLACEGHEFHPPDRAAQVATADSAYAALNFDSVTWASDSARIQGGNEVYAANCRTCHGTLGRGQTDYAAQRDLEPPSLVRADWPAGDSLAHVRRRVYTGHAAGMPTFGVARLSPREIDAVAHYIVEGLRPEVLGRR
jgi:mono/diheme cytochrome c family protein